MIASMVLLCRFCCAMGMSRVQCFFAYCSSSSLWAQLSWHLHAGKVEVNVHDVSEVSSDLPQDAAGEESGLAL